MDNRNNVYFYYRQNDTLLEKLKPLFEDVKKLGFNVVHDYSDANIIISVGGDGEFLQTVRHTGFKQDSVYLGIAVGDEAGLYCDFHLDYYDKMLEAMKNNDVEVRRFPAITTTINGKSTFYCLNEATIRSAIIKTIVMDVFIDDHHFERFRGDGLIVSTPTGSTGYNKSTTGAVIDPKIPCFQVSELASVNNNRYRTLGSSFILSENRKLKLEVIQDGNDYPIIGLDNEAYSIRNIRSVTIELSEKRIKTIKLKNNSFWHRVQRTFL